MEHAGQFVTSSLLKDNLRTHVRQAAHFGSLVLDRIERVLHARQLVFLDSMELRATALAAGLDGRWEPLGYAADLMDVDREGDSYRGFIGGPGRDLLARYASSLLWEVWLVIAWLRRHVAARGSPLTSSAMSTVMPGALSRLVPPQQLIQVERDCARLALSALRYD